MTNAMPESIKNAVTAIWISIALGALDTLIQKFTGRISEGEFIFRLIVYGISVMFPYKISKGSNPARYVWTVFFVIGILAMIGGVIPKVSGITLILLGFAEITITSLSIYWLFTKEANIWLNKTGNGTQ